MEVGKQPRYETSEMKLDNGGVNNRDWRNCDSGRQHPRVKEDRESLDEVGSEWILEWLSVYQPVQAIMARLGSQGSGG